MIETHDTAQVHGLYALQRLELYAFDRCRIDAYAFSQHVVERVRHGGLGSLVNLRVRTPYGDRVSLACVHAHALCASVVSPPVDADDDQQVCAYMPEHWCNEALGNDLVWTDALARAAAFPRLQRRDAQMPLRGLAPHPAPMQQPVPNEAPRPALLPRQLVFQMPQPPSPLFPVPVKCGGSIAGSECCVCFAAPVNVLYVPCGHATVCERCMVANRKVSPACPSCGMRVERVVPVFVHMADAAEPVAAAATPNEPPAIQPIPEQGAAAIDAAMDVQAAVPAPVAPAAQQPSVPWRLREPRPSWQLEPAQALDNYLAALSARQLTELEGTVRPQSETWLGIEREWRRRAATIDAARDVVDLSGA
jgi:hypothetical protein